VAARSRFSAEIAAGENESCGEQVMASNLLSWLARHLGCAAAVFVFGLVAVVAPPRAVAQGGPVAEGAKSPSLPPPTVPIEEIIQKFAAKETEFKAERENFTYKQTFRVQTLDEDNRVDGEYLMKSDIDFNPDGKRTEVVTYAPQPTLERISLSEEDLSDLEHLYPFVLTTTELSNYDIKYVDHRPLDDLTTYVFDVAPKSIGKNQRLFEGRIWVDDKDLQIVKTYGKPVGYAKKKSGMNQAFPHFETFRENIEGKYWFPTYTRADEMLHFGPGSDVHIRVMAKYEDYKRYGVTTKITPIGQAPAAPTAPNQKK
jgi:hypothetical protein